VGAVFDAAVVDAIAALAIAWRYGAVFLVMLCLRVIRFDSPQ
jgi:hypothetical protein